jgi:hypothetical protein
MFDTEFAFKSGKLTAIMDGGAGSSGKGKVASFVAEHANNWQFCCNGFSAQAGHWVKLDDGREYFYQTFNSCAYLTDKYEKMYIGPGACIELPALLREYEENKLKPGQLGIHPLASIIQDKDMAFERGEVSFEGDAIERHDGTMKTGSTCHGVGAAKARRVLRRPDVLLVKDIPQLKEFVCDTEDEIIERLDSGQAGLLEIAQGFQLSLLHKTFYPYVTSRNVTISAALDDMFLPPVYAGPVIINFRTFPIRINNQKYLDPETKKHLVWEEVAERGGPDSDKVEIYEGNSGPGYDDQEEISWDDLTKNSRSPDPIIEMTSVTKLPRRVFTFSKKNLAEAIKYNRTGDDMHISINFANYIDYDLTGLRQAGGLAAGSDKFTAWAKENIIDEFDKVKFIGTGAKTDDMVLR